MLALGIVFSDIHEWSMGDLTYSRTVAGIPYAGRYWLIDFVLSNMINSHIHKVGVITKSNYQSLMEHIGSGKDWDLSRKNGGISILPPYGEDSRGGLYKGRLDALIRIMKYIQDSTEEYVIMSDCDMICNIDYRDVIKQHTQTNADITAIYHEHHISDANAQYSILYNVAGRTGRIKEVTLYPSTLEGTYKVSLNSWVMRRDYLINLIINAVSNGKTKFSRDVLLSEVDNINIYGYEYKGYCAHINSIKSFFDHNLDMLDTEKRNDLFGVKGRPIYTKVRDSAPTRYGNNASVKNSLIADGCYIDGEVINSVISRGVRIGKNSRIRNCIIMQDTLIGEGCEVDWVICDKNVMVRDYAKLAADKNFYLYITKNIMI